jgi:hypothetical protein
MNGTGAGITGREDTINFQKYIVKFVCKYYFELKPVFGDRPNVRPFFTNEDDYNETGNNENSNQNGNTSSDEESLFDVDNNELRYDGNYNVQSNSVSKGSTTVGRVQNSREIDVGTSIDPTIDAHIQSTLVDCDSSSVGNVTTGTGMNSCSTSLSHSASQCTSRSNSSRNGTNTNSSNKRKQSGNGGLSPQMARKIQKNLLKSHHRQINDKKKTPKLQTMMEQEEDDRKFLRESRISKMKFEEDQMKERNIREDQKIRIEHERLRLEKAQSDLNERKIESETQLNNQRMMMVRLEIFKERQALKKSDPSLSDDYLDTLFPIQK